MAMTPILAQIHKRRASAIAHQDAGTETTRGPDVWAALIETLDAQIARRVKEEQRNG